MSGALRSVLVTLLLAGCSATPSPPPASVPELAAVEAFPAIAAEFRTSYVATTKQRANDEREVSWRLWRTPERIVTENLSAHTGEIWQRDGAATFMNKVFHEDRRAVSYQTDDLTLSHQLSSWSRQALLVAPELLQQLQLKSVEWRDGQPLRRYVGDYEGASWDITLRTDIALPVRMIRTHDGLRQTTELVQSTPLEQSPWSPTPADDYEIIEFADLGDRQSDPFVVKAQEQLGKPHTH